MNRLAAYCPIMDRFRRKLGGWSGFGAALVAVALMAQVLIPQGFMASAQTGGYPLVICTGHGPLLSTADPSTPAKAPKTADHAVCLFSGHGPASTPDSAPSLIARLTYLFAPIPAAASADRIPGRGLAAPPPQSHAPPTSLI